MAEIITGCRLSAAAQIGTDGKVCFPFSKDSNYINVEHVLGNFVGNYFHLNPENSSALKIYGTPVKIDRSIVTSTPDFVHLFVYTNQVDIYQCDLGNDTSSKPFLWISDCIFYGGFRMLFNHFSSVLIFNSDYFKDSCIIANPNMEPLYGKQEGYFLRCAFQHSTFQKGVSFNLNYIDNSRFGRRCKFNENLTFSNCYISGLLDLHDCQFDTTCTLIFKETPLPDAINFSHIKLSIPIDLTDVPLAEGKKVCEINMVGADFDKILMQYDKFHLWFSDTMLKGEKYRDIVNSTYEGLLAVFKRKGLNESYEKLDCEFRDWQWMNGKDRWQFFSWFWWGYGYEKGRVLLWMILFLIAFSLLNMCFYDKLLEVYVIDKLKRNGLTGFAKLFTLSVIFTGTVFFKVGLDYDKLEIKNKGLFFLIVFEFLTGLLCVAYIVSWILSK